MSNGTIFVQTNMETYETGGAGDGVPHLTSQGSVVLTGDGRHLLVTNAGSGELSVFAVGSDGLRLVETVSSASSRSTGAATWPATAIRRRPGSRRTGPPSSGPTPYGFAYRCRRRPVFG